MMNTKYLFFSWCLFLIFGIIAYPNITLSTDKHMDNFYTKENIERMKREDTINSKPWPKHWLPSIVVDPHTGGVLGREEPPQQRMPCTTPLSTAQEAEECVHHRFSRAREDNLMEFARSAGHIGDTRHCERGVESRFSSVLDEFVATLRNARMKCQSNMQDPSTYFCLGETSVKMCHRDKGDVYTLRAVINKNTARFVTFSPSQFGSERINH